MFSPAQTSSLTHRTSRSDPRATPYPTNLVDDWEHTNLVRYCDGPVESPDSSTVSYDSPYDSSYDSAPSTPPSDAGSALSEPRKRPNRRGPDHIPRPRNAFVLFRSHLCASGKITKKVEGDHRHISITAANVWHGMSDDAKRPYYLQAEFEKLEHRRLYPNYRFTPTVRKTKPLKRKVQRNGAKDKKRCDDVAKLILAGKEGRDLEDAVRTLDQATAAGIEFVVALPPASSARAGPGPVVRGWVPQTGRGTPDGDPSYSLAAPPTARAYFGNAVEQCLDGYVPPPNYSSRAPNHPPTHPTALDPAWNFVYPRSIHHRVTVEPYTEDCDRPFISAVATYP